ncbi:UNVERIFIED_CONTAM: hypothetical protein FKN15_035130 [Acipenser sinensis]
MTSPSCIPQFPSVSLAYEKAESDIMNLKPRNPRKDRLVNESLAAYSYFQIGAIQSFAGFTDYFTCLAQEGWRPLLCVGLRSAWENAYNQEVQDSYGQEWVRQRRSYSCLRCLPPAGAIQSFAGFTDYFTCLAQEGWRPLLCVGLRSAWENAYNQEVQDSYGQEWVRQRRSYSCLEKLRVRLSLKQGCQSPLLEGGPQQWLLAFIAPRARNSIALII